MEPVPVPSGPGRRGLRPQAKLAAFVVLIFAVGAAGWLLFGGGDNSGASNAGLGSVAAGPLSGRGETASGDAAREAGISTTGTASNILRAEGVAAAMRRASDARARGDFEDAILAYNDALSLDPDHAAARAGLFDAGEIFRERRAINDQLRKARIAFEDGEYSAALRLFYRLPENSVDDVTLTRYKVNGWINLSILGLKAGDTEQAIEHLADALELSNQHPRALHLMVFAEEHDGTAIARSYYVEVNEMEFLGLED
jgi:tetratricopeptide (TPR) repeat protein